MARHSQPYFQRSELRSQHSELSVQFEHLELRLQFSVLSIFYYFFQSNVQSHVFSSTFKVIMSFFNQAFRSTISLQFDVQSRIFILAFKAVVCFNLTFRVVFLVWHSKLLFDLAFRVVSLVQCLEPSFIVWSSESSFIPGVQSYHILGFSFRATFLAFRVVFLFQFGVQSHITSIQDCHFLLV